MTAFGPSAGPQGPQGVPGPAMPNVRFKARQTTAFSLTNMSSFTLAFNSSVYNAGGGSYNASTGIYTVPQAGLYRVTSIVRGTAPSANQWIATQLQVGAGFVQTATSQRSTQNGEVLTATLLTTIVGAVGI